MLFILTCLVLFLMDYNRDGIPDMMQMSANLDIYDLGRLARAMDVTVLVGVLPSGWLGAWCHRRREITMKPDLPRHIFRSVLAHELGHAHLGHSGYNAPDSIPERAADRFAAKHLIRMDDYHAAMATHGDDIHAMARELNVMPWVVNEFRRTTSGGLFSRVGMAVPPVAFDRPMCSIGVIGDCLDEDDEIMILGNNVLR
jgi:hypothetical protein